MAAQDATAIIFLQEPVYRLRGDNRAKFLKNKFFLAKPIADLKLPLINF
jgi:hypothetical protein